MSAPATREYDPLKWSAADVQAFVERIVPGRTCVDPFRYMSGFVLASLSREDLMRLMQGDEDAVDSLWAELVRLRDAPLAPPASEDRARVGEATRDTIVVFVQTPSETALEFEVLPGDVVASLKCKVAELAGVLAEEQRLVWRGKKLLDEATLEGAGVGHGSQLLLVPKLVGGSATVAAPTAPRGGLLLCPGGLPIAGAAASRGIFLPVACTEGSLQFSVYLVFDSDQDRQAFVAACGSRPAPLGPLASRMKKRVVENAPPPLVEIFLRRGARARESLVVKAKLDGREEGGEEQLLRLDIATAEIASNSRLDVAIHLDGHMDSAVRKLRAMLVSGSRCI